MSTRVLFHRDFRRWTGGHVVHAQYMRTLAAMPGYEVRLYLTPESAPVATSPWAAFADRVEPRWQPDAADILVVAGTDWLAHPRARALELERPFINLIQHVRHADPQHALHEFLDRRAVRICVSEPVHAELAATGRCNGPLVTIRNALTPDLAQFEGATKDVAVAIVAIKQPTMAEELGAALERAGVTVDVVPRCDRQTFLARIARARVVVGLPNAREGFYLPALEAMALDCLVVCPDCVGNRCFCAHGVNCLMPREYTVTALVEAVLAAHALPEAARSALREAGRRTAAAHDEASLRDGLARVLGRL